MKLTDQAIRAAAPRTKAPFRILDDDNLYLVVYPSGRKSFEYRYRDDGRLRALILGPYGTRDGELTLRAARMRRDALTALRAQGGDPIAAARLEGERQQHEILRLRAVNAEARAHAKAERARIARASLTFKTVADSWIATTCHLWGAAHAVQVEQSMRDHVYPKIGDRGIHAIKPADVIDLLDGMLAKGIVETTRRVRQRIDAVFEYAGLHHDVQGNPIAQARRELKKRFKVAAITFPEASFPCVPLSEVPQLLGAMKAYVGTHVTRTLLWFVALTACRTGEARFATWDEFDLDAGVWTVPAQRMKARRENVVPLAPPVVTLLRDLRAHSGSKPFVFPHPRRDDRPASEAAILYALAALGYGGRMTGHGFRQVFSTLANTSKKWRSDVIEVALAHAEKDAVRAAYNKANYGDERRELMTWYASELIRLRDSVERATVQ